jgi:hypothetical protein
VAIEHYGRRLRIAPPVLSHAAIMNFFARVDKLLVRVQMVGNVTNIGNGNQITPEQNRVIVFQPSESDGAAAQLKPVKLTSSYAVAID